MFTEKFKWCYGFEKSLIWNTFIFSKLCYYIRVGNIYENSVINDTYKRGFKKFFGNRISYKRGTTSFFEGGYGVINLINKCRDLNKLWLWYVVNQESVTSFSTIFKKRIFKFKDDKNCIRKMFRNKHFPAIDNVKFIRKVEILDSCKSTFDT